MSSTPPNTDALVAHSVRVLQTWTPARIRAAEAAADVGNFRLAADLFDVILADERVKSAFQSRCFALGGYPIKTEPYSEGEAFEKAAEELERDFWVSAPEEQRNHFLTWGLGLGVCSGVLRWKNGGKVHNNRYIPQLEGWHPQHLSYDSSRDVWRQTISSGATVDITPGDGAWLLFTPFGKLRAGTNGLWRGLARWVLFKSYAILDWARHGEKAATWVAFSETTTVDPKLRKDLGNSIYTAAKNAVVVLPPGLKLDLLEATANTRDIYLAQVNAADAAIDIAVRGANLTASVTTGGGRAAAEVHERGESKVVRADSQSFSSFYRQQVSVPAASINYGDGDLAAWLEWEVDEAEDVKSHAEASTTLQDSLSKARKNGFKVNHEKFIARFGYDYLEVDPDFDPHPPVPPALAGKEPGKNGDEEQPTGESEDAEDEAPEAVTRALNAMGDDYVDKLTKQLGALGAKAIRPTIAKLVTAVEGAPDYHHALAAVEQVFDDLPPPYELARVTEQALMLAEHVGYFEAHAESLRQLEP